MALNQSYSIIWIFFKISIYFRVKIFPWLFPKLRIFFLDHFLAWGNPYWVKRSAYWLKTAKGTIDQQHCSHLISLHSNVTYGPWEFPLNLNCGWHSFYTHFIHYSNFTALFATFFPTTFLNNLNTTRCWAFELHSCWHSLTLFAHLPWACDTHSQWWDPLCLQLQQMPGWSTARMSTWTYPLMVENNIYSN